MKKIIIQLGNPGDTYGAGVAEGVIVAPLNRFHNLAVTRGRNGQLRLAEVSTKRVAPDFPGAFYSIRALKKESAQRQNGHMKEYAHLLDDAKYEGLKFLGTIVSSGKYK